MNIKSIVSTNLKSKVSGIGLTVVVIFLVVLALHLVTGRGFGVWTFISSTIRPIADLGQAMAGSRSVSSYSHGNFTNIIFLHHSTGYNLIEQGGGRSRLSEAGYNFWDHGYNAQGLRYPDGTYTGYSYNIPDDNTNPDGLARIFSQQLYNFPLNTFSGLLQHEVIVFKSCFPVSHITSHEQLETYKSYYLAMREVMDQHPDKVFIVITPPPLNPASTNTEAAVKARAFANWLKSDLYLNGHPNVFTFDLFGYLAEDDSSSPDLNMLRAEYRAGTDSHPNQIANEKIGPLFADFIINTTHKYHAIFGYMHLSAKSDL